MGLRPACEVAQSALWFLLDFERHESVKVSSYIDNIRFVGPREHTVAAIRIFLGRCKKVGAQLDRWPKDESEEAIVALSETKGGFLGEFYDYEKSTRCLVDKTLKKITYVHDLLDFEQPIVLTARQFSTLMGLVFWSASVLSINLSNMFHLLRAYRESASEAANTSFDGVLTTLSKTARSELKAWFKVAMENRPVPMVAPSSEPSLCIVADASAAGYGAFAQVRGSAEWKVLSGMWPSHLKDKVTSSVFAEPEAIYLACLRFLRPEDKFVRIYTDHSPLVYANRSGYAKGFHPNELLRRLHETFPGVVFEILHVKGVHNPADATSRIGGSVGEDYVPTVEEKDKLAMLEAVMWEGAVKDNVPVYAYNRHSFMV